MKAVSFCEANTFSLKLKFEANTKFLTKSFYSKVVCIGAPRLHEHLKVNYDSLRIKSIVLDIDSRLKVFFQKNEFFEYNMLNDYYFDGPENRILFEEFMKETEYKFIASDD